MATPDAYEFNPDFSPDGSRIVFEQSTDRRLYDDIFSVRADGTHRRHLTRGKANDQSPSYSPGGRRIAFARQRPPGRASFRIYTMRADGSRLRRVTGGQNPSWGAR